MLASVESVALYGIEGIPIKVEVDIASGLPSFTTVGLPESTVKEARVRVQSAIANSDYIFPAGRISVNLAPAHVRKEGTGFDLPIGLSILAASGVFPKERLSKVFALAELSLSGDVRPVKGVIAAAHMAKKNGAKFILVAEENGPEAALVEGLAAYTVKNFKDAVTFINSDSLEGAVLAKKSEDSSEVATGLDLEDVIGQYQARRALEIAASGGHNILFIGGPGSGKTMLAKRLPGILPAMSDEEAFEVTKVHSVAGLTMGTGLIKARPFRSPHHTTSRAGLVGGGTGIPRPGELSLASNGVLFLDELVEFPRSVLEVLRQPLESGEVILSRANGSLTYPAKIMLVAAMNPCPCGYHGHKKRACRCQVIERIRYRGRLSGPLLDRIDLHVDVPPVEIEMLDKAKKGESSAIVRKRVQAAREKQHTTYGGSLTNANAPRARFVENAIMEDKARKLLLTASLKLGFSARSYDRIIRVAKTIADMEGSQKIEMTHLAEALQYRGENGS